MNNKFKRALSSVLAFIMLLSCMTVMNVSSVWAADAITESFSYGVSDFLGNNFNSAASNALVAPNENITVGTGTFTLQDYGTRQKKQSSSTSLTNNTGKTFTKELMAGGSSNRDISFTAGADGTVIAYGYADSKSSKSFKINGTSVSTTAGTVMAISTPVKAGDTFKLGFDSNLCFLGLDYNVGGDTPVDPTTYTIQLGEYDTTTYPVVTLDKTSTTTKGDTVTASWEANTGYQAGSKSIELTDDMLSETTYTITVDAAWFTAIGGSDIPTPSTSKTLDFSEEAVATAIGVTSGKTNSSGTYTDLGTDGYFTVYLSGGNRNFTDGYLQFGSANDSISFTTTTANAVVTVKVSSNGGTARTLVWSPEVTADVNNADISSTTAVEHTYTLGEAGTYTIKCQNARFYTVTVSEGGTVDTTTDVTVTVNVKDAAGVAMDADSVSVALGTATATVASTATGVYTATFADVENTALAAGLTATATVTKSGYKTATGTATVTTAAGSIDVVLEAETPVNDDVTVTVYDSTTGNKVTGKIYYWVTLAAAGTTNELNISDGNGIIPVTEIAAGTYTPSGSIVANTSAATDMTDAITNGVLYVSAEGYAGAEVKLPASGNVNVQLVPLPTVNISEAGVYSVNAGKIVEALLASGTADYSYQNPYIKSAEVNGFKMTAAGNNQVIKVMPKVNTRNQTRDSLVQLSKGCTIEYTPSTSGQLTIAAASPNSSTTRGYAVDGTTTTPNSVTLTSTSSASSTFALTKDTPCTITITNTVDGDDGGINIYSIEFVPDEVQKYPVTLNVTGDTLGTTTVNVNDAALSSGTAYDEYSTVSITAVPSGDNKVAVTVNGVTVSLTDNAYTFTLTGETTIAVAYSENEIEVTDKLLPLTVGETIDFTTASLTAKNESYVTVNGENKVKYFADAVSGGGKTSDIKLQANNATNYVEIIAGSDGNLAVTFNGNDIRVTGSDGSTQILSRSDVSANNDVMRTIKVTEGVTYTITALTDSDKTSGANVGNAYISAVSLLAATVEAGKNITTIYATEEINDAEILAAYNASGADRYVRIIGQLNGITDSNATSVDEVGFVILNCSYADWENAGFADTNLQGEIKVSTVYPDVYSSTGFDSSKVADNGTYTGTTLNLSGLNTYFDTLVYGSDADFTGTYIYTFTEIDGTRYYYNSNAELTEKTF